MYSTESAALDRGRGNSRGEAVASFGAWIKRRAARAKLHQSIAKEHFSGVALIAARRATDREFDELTADMATLGRERWRMRAGHGI